MASIAIIKNISGNNVILNCDGKLEVSIDYVASPYKDYYFKIRDIKTINAKKSEYCVIRDITFIIFIILNIIFTCIWKEFFLKELIVVLFAYIISVV